MRTGPGRGAAATLVLALAACTNPSISPADDRGTAIAAQPRDRDSADDHSHNRERLPAYSASVRLIGPRLRDRTRYSHHRGCPVQLTDLRYLRVSYVGFDGRSHSGELVVHRRYADAVVDVFGRLYRARWPIQQMRLVDRYRGRDERSMAANNTSAYNCRHVAGSDRWSAHAYGTAIDLNPMQNPYVTESSIHPPAAARFAKIDRSATARRLPVGAIHDGDIVVRSFARIGWEWGGNWAALPDYQHFSAKVHDGGREPTSPVAPRLFGKSPQPTSERKSRNVRGGRHGRETSAGRVVQRVLPPAGRAALCDLRRSG